jgi:subtilisin family serine protease
MPPVRTPSIPFAVALAAIVMGFSAPAARAESADVLVGFAPEATAAKRTAVLADAGGTRPQTLASTADLIVERVSVPGGARALERLADAPGVRWAASNQSYRVASAPTVCEETRGDPGRGTVFTDSLACRQWYLTGTSDAIGAAESWSEIVSARGTLLAVLDTGVDFTHPDLVDRAWENPTDGTFGFDIPGDTRVPRDSTGHGTAVAGVAAASADEGGTTGVCPACTVMDVKLVRDSTATASAADIIEGIHTAAANGVKVINLSLGAPSSPQLKAAFVDVMRAYPSIVFVTAAGNERHSTDVHPESPCDAAGAVANGLCVAYTGLNDELAYFSNYGSAVDIAAPGDDIYAPSLDGGYEAVNGTSFATPLVAGSAALLRGMGASARQSVQALLAGGRPAAPPRLDVTGALEAFRGMGPDTDPPPPQPPATPTPTPEATPTPDSEATTPVPRRSQPDAPEPVPGTPKRAAAANPALLSFRRVSHRAGSARVEVSCRAACTLTVRVYAGSTRLLLSHVRLSRRGSSTLTLRMTAARYRKLRTLTVRADGPGYPARRLTRRVTALR